MHLSFALEFHGIHNNFQIFSDAPRNGPRSDQHSVPGVPEPTGHLRSRILTHVGGLWECLLVKETWPCPLKQTTRSTWVPLELKDELEPFWGEPTFWQVRTVNFWELYIENPRIQRIKCWVRGILGGGRFCHLFSKVKLLDIKLKMILNLATFHINPIYRCFPSTWKLPGDFGRKFNPFTTCYIVLLWIGVLLRGVCK